jgi:ribosomal protein L37AE/L43A
VIKDAPADIERQPIYPPCPTCLERGEQEASRPIPLGDGVWLCIKCGAEFTCEEVVQRDLTEKCKPETRLLKRLPPDAFRG